MSDDHSLPNNYAELLKDLRSAYANGDAITYVDYRKVLAPAYDAIEALVGEVESSSRFVNYYMNKADAAEKKLDVAKSDLEECKAMLASRGTILLND